MPTWKDSCNLNIDHLCPSRYIAVISVISCNPPKMIWPLGRWWSISARHSLLWAEGRPMLWLPGWMSEAQDLHLFTPILSRRTKLRKDQRCQLLQPLLFCWGLHFWRLDQLPSTALSSSSLMYQGDGDDLKMQTCLTHRLILWTLYASSGMKRIKNKNSRILESTSGFHFLPVVGQYGNHKHQAKHQAK